MENSRKDSSSQRGRNSRKDSAILNYPFSILHFIDFSEKNK